MGGCSFVLEKEVMSAIYCHFRPTGTDITVDGQHISRLTDADVRELIVHLLVFGGKELRSDIRYGLDGGKFDELGNVPAWKREAKP